MSTTGQFHVTRSPLAAQPPYLAIENMLMRLPFMLDQRIAFCSKHATKGMHFAAPSRVDMVLVIGPQAYGAETMC